jgi:hypothetical protein
MIRLTRREKLLAGGLLVFTVAWFSFAAGISPAFERIRTLNRVISEKQRELEKIRSLSKEYIYLSEDLSKLNAKDDTSCGPSELLPFLESRIDECGLSENVESIKRKVAPIDSAYSEIIIEIRLNNVSIGRLVDFLGKIETSQTCAATKSLYIERNSHNENLLDSVIEIYGTRANSNKFARI